MTTDDELEGVGGFEQEERRRLLHCEESANNKKEKKGEEIKRDLFFLLEPSSIQRELLIHGIKFTLYRYLFYHRICCVGDGYECLLRTPLHHILFILNTKH